jgi:CMP-N,N'-diacetyllegionaminic acid synthase
MKSKKKILGIIGIRSGSSELKDKNIKMLGNKHLIGWILDAAKNSKRINKIIVSTDSKKYQKIVRKYRVEAPFLRPKKISKHSSDEIDFIKHTLNYLQKNENYKPDIVVRMLATVPFQKAKDIDRVIDIILKKKYKSSVIVSEAKQHFNKALKIIGKTHTQLVSCKTKKGVDVGKKLNRQKENNKDKNVYFRSNVICCTTDVIKKFNSLTDNNVGYHIISNKGFVDIDSNDDFKYAEYLYLKDFIHQK